MNINRRFLKMASNYTYKPLNDELALEKGIENFYEIMIYVILIGFSVWEMAVSNHETTEKKRVHPPTYSAAGRTTGQLQGVASRYGVERPKGQPKLRDDGGEAKGEDTRARVAATY